MGRGTTKLVKQAEPDKMSGSASADPWKGFAPVPLGNDALTEKDPAMKLVFQLRKKKEREQAKFDAGVLKRKAQFAAIDKKVRDGRDIVVRGINQMIPALAQMEPFLSRKGDEHHSPHIRMLIAAGLPTWEEYTKLIADEFEVSVRTVQRKLEAHRGHTKEKQPSGKTKELTPRWTLRQQRQAAKALDVAKGAIEAIKAGKPVKQYLPAWNAVAYTPTAEPLDADPVSGFIDTVLTPYAVHILRYVRALEDAVFYHAPELREDRDNRVWQYKQSVYDAPQELKEVFFQARKIINAARLTVSADSTPVGGSVQVREAAPDQLGQT